MKQPRPLLMWGLVLMLLVGLLYFATHQPVTPAPAKPVPTQFHPWPYEWEC